MIEKLNLNVGDRIALFRKRNNWLQEELATKLGIARSTLANYEANKKELGINELAKIAEVLGVTIYDLISGSVPQENIKELSYDEIKNKLLVVEMELSAMKRELADKEKIIFLYEQQVEQFKKSITKAKSKFTGNS